MENGRINSVKNIRKFFIGISCLATVNLIVAFVPGILYASLPGMCGHESNALVELGCMGTVTFLGMIVDLGIAYICVAILTESLSALGKMKHVKIFIRTALVISVIVAAVMFLGKFEYASVRDIKVDSKPLTGFETMSWLAGTKEKIMGNIQAYDTISCIYHPTSNTEIIVKILNILLIELSGIVIILCSMYTNHKKQEEVYKALGEI